MKGQRRKNRFIKRRSWGSRRSRIRQRLAKGNYEIEPEFLRSEDSWHLIHHVCASRLREKLRLHPKRYRRISWMIESVIGYGKGNTDDIERRFGIFYPRCRKCGKKDGTWGFWNRIIDEETAGLCETCAKVILNERERRRIEAKNEKALVIARKLMPGDVIERMEKVGWVSVRARVCLRIVEYDHSRIYRTAVGYTYSSPRDVEYRLRKDGRIYNATTKESYCVHVQTKEGWLNYSLGYMDWDQLMELWLLLRYHPDRIEAIANKTPMKDEQWVKLFPIPKNERVRKTRVVVSSYIPNNPGRMVAAQGR